MSEISMAVIGQFAVRGHISYTEQAAIRTRFLSACQYNLLSNIITIN